MHRILLVGMLSTALCGCGGGSGGSGPGTVGSVPAPTPTPTPTPTPSPTPSPTPVALVPASQASVRFGECVNMANMLEAPNEGDWGRPIAEDDFQIIAAAGFKTVRLPVRWSSHAGSVPPYTIDAAFLARVEHVVQRAHAANLLVIMDDHHYDAIFANPSAEADRFTAIWRQIGARFRSYPEDKLWFELMNEPHDAVNDSNLGRLMNNALAAVRETNPTRKVVIGGQNYSDVNSLATVPLPSDPNIVATFHYYDPYAFTHQGVTFLSSPPPFGRSYPQSGDAAQLQRDVDKVRTFIARTGVPVFLGEFGANEAIPNADRVAYHRAVHDAFKSTGVNGCVWGDTNGFPIRVGSTWNTDILQALGL